MGSPKPSTSGISIIYSLKEEEETTIEDADKCCVCQRFSPPPNLNDNPYLKIVNWAKCDSCSHWVHLAFCDRELSEEMTVSCVIIVLNKGALIHFKL